MIISHELSQGSSSSSSLTYDVFLSFRGIDTRLNFTNHLHKALEDASLITFLDDQEIDTTLYLKPELESAVKASRSSIIVLSKNYASSTRCLEELVLILEQHKTSSQMVFPIFYHVNPTDVRKQQNSFGDAMERHKQRMEAETNVEGKSLLAQKMVTWKKALTEVTDLEGIDAKGRLETEFIEAIVTDIKRCLGVPLWSTLPDLIGMDCSVRFISSWLKDGSTHTADILTILGMGGIGKTSLAKYVYDMHHILFNRSSFVVDINRKCRDEYDKLRELQMQVLVDISEISSEQIPAQFVSVYTSNIEKALARNKVLLVLDDIDSLDQLNVLLGGKGFHPGSKIIITTKDASLARRYKFSNPLVQPNHTTLSLEGLNETSSLQLLSFHAFKRIGPTEGYKQVCKKLLKFCERLPLVLKVLGCSLCDQDVAEWEEYIGGLEHETDSTYRRVLQMSFDSLPSQNDKELFKHIACFFVGMDRDYTETILKACGIRTLHGIRNLLDRCLLAIGPRNELTMHQLLQDMGKDMVCQESHDKPWKRSRLWCHKDSFNVLQQKKGKGSLKGIVLDMRMLEKENLHGSLTLRTDALSKMDNLMLLQLNYVQLKGSYKNFPKQLRWLCMHGFPSPSIPFDLQMENLVALDMSYSKIKKFDMSCSNMKQLSKTLKLTGHSKDKRLLGSLKILNLSFCEQLHSLGGFIEFPALERLIVTNCIDLTEVSESIEQCVELVIIDLSYCKKLEKLPTTLGKLKKVKKLLLHDCNLRNPPIEMRDRDSQEMARTEIFRIDSQTSSSAITEAVPHHLEFFRVSVPSSLEQYNRNVEERKEQEQKELERNKREENERKERERIEQDYKRDERECIEQECIKREENERKERERIEQERIKREEDERKEWERIEQERIKREEKERNERELCVQERNEREESERNERNEQEEREQLLKDLNERMEQQRIEQHEKWQRQQEEERNQPRAPEKMEDHWIVKGVDELPTPSYLVVALAVNGSRKTKYVIKWALDKFVPEGILLFKLFFVRPKITWVPTPMGTVPVSQVREDVVIAYKKEVEWQADQKLLPYKNMCARKKVDVDIVHIESDDIVDAIKQEIVKQKINKLVIGASSNGMFSRGRNLSSRLSESIPSFCTVYAISKGKLSSLRASDSETVGSSKDDDNTSDSSSITNSSFAQTEWTDQGSASTYSQFFSNSLPMQRIEALSSINRTLHKRTSSLESTGNKLDSSEGDEAPASYGSNPDYLWANSTASSSKSFLTENHSWTSDQDSIPYAPSEIASEIQDTNMSFELEKLRVELRHIRGMYAMAQSETFDASRRLNDLQKQQLEESIKLKELKVKEEESKALAEQQKKEHEAAKRQAEYVKECLRREAAVRLDAEERTLQESKEKQKLQKAITGTSQKYENFTWDEIVTACSSFNEDLKIGTGGNGTVYKSSFHHTVAAVKVLHSQEAHRTKQFQQELEVLSRIRHPHLLILIGACVDHGCLVYEYMENGSLDDRLFRINNTLPIPWFDRFRIAWEVASALLFLHNTKPKSIVHRDLKPANILLDRNLVSKIGDVGVSTMLQSDPCSTSTVYKDTTPAGTYCYIDPEYQRTGLVSPKSDVYALGMVILQLLTAKPAIGLTYVVETAIEDDELATVLDLEAGEWPVDESKELAILGLSCAELRRKDRPDLKTVVLPTLERLKAVADEAQRTTSMARTTPPNHFICPILKDVMIDPCVAADGYTYDRRAIEKWFEESDNSPMTNLPLTSRSLTPNYTLFSAIMEWKSRT